MIVYQILLVWSSWIEILLLFCLFVVLLWMYKQLIFYSFYIISRFDVDVPGGRVYKESSFTESGWIFTLYVVLRLDEPLVLL